MYWYGLVKDFDNYVIRNDGVIINIITKRESKGCVDNHGYLMVGLTNEGKTKHFHLHRLLGKAFIDGEDANHYTIDHIDQNKLNNDLSNLKLDGSEDNDIYFSGDIIQQSVSLVPEIMNAELERYSEKKHKHIDSLKRLTNKLYKNSYRLERSNSNGKDFLPILRSELKKFKKLQSSWMLTL